MPKAKYVALTALMVTAGSRAAFACIPIYTVADLNNVRNNLTGNYCLAADIDLGLIGSFDPIGTGPAPFKGNFDGKGFVIRRLKVSSNASDVGLFGVTLRANIHDVKLRGIVVRSTGDFAHVGGLVGSPLVTKLTNVQVNGVVSCSGQTCRVGGLAGESDDKSQIVQSVSAAQVAGGQGGAAGGLIGQSDGVMKYSYASGAVTCKDHCAAGGLVGQTTKHAEILQSFATGTVRVQTAGNSGGFAGTQDGTVKQSYATGPVSSGKSETIGGAIGVNSGRVDQMFAIGFVKHGKDSFAGGFNGGIDTPNEPITHVYWDTETSQQAMSFSGTGKTTAQLQADKPAGFGSAWGITKTITYPYLKSKNLAYRSTLATMLNLGIPYVFLPVEQREPTEYAKNVKNADLAALAAVYTVLGRAAGEALQIADLQNVAIDKYFWNDASKTATFRGPITDQMSLGPLKNISAGTVLGESNVIGKLRNHSPVILRGSISAGGSRAKQTHWMLATSFITDEEDNVTGIVALDPWAGLQVTIDPATKQVVSPNNFPLTGFQVDGYQPVIFAL